MAVTRDTTFEELINELKIRNLTLISLGEVPSASVVLSYDKYVIEGDIALINTLHWEHIGHPVVSPKQTVHVGTLVLVRL